MWAALCVGAGGFVGAVARYLLGLIPYEGEFPLITFLINFLGSVVIGVVFEASTTWSLISPNATLFLKTGLCGGFTTFSAFSLETLSLFERGSYGTAALYAGGSVVVCVAGVALGRVLAQSVLTALRGCCE